MRQYGPDPTQRVRSCETLPRELRKVVSILRRSFPAPLLTCSSALTADFGGLHLNVIDEFLDHLILVPFQLRGEPDRFRFPDDLDYDGLSSERGGWLLPDDPDRFHLPDDLDDNGLESELGSFVLSLCLHLHWWMVLQSEEVQE